MVNQSACSIVKHIIRCAEEHVLWEGVLTCPLGYLTSCSWSGGPRSMPTTPNNGLSSADDGVWPAHSLLPPDIIYTRPAILVVLFKYMSDGDCRPVGFQKRSKHVESRWGCGNGEFTALNMGYPSARRRGHQANPLFAVPTTLYLVGGDVS